MSSTEKYPFGLNDVNYAWPKPFPVSCADITHDNWPVMLARLRAPDTNAANAARLGIGRCSCPELPVSVTTEQSRQPEV